MNVRKALSIGGLLVLAAVAQGTLADAAPSAINFRTPFVCKQVWTAATYSAHNPQLAVDFQRANATGQTVSASAAGTVSLVANLGNKSYGRYIVIDHGSGLTTLYAHLSAQNVKKGDKVTTKTVIGKVGATGNVTGPHLHYEQRSGSTVQKVVLNGVHIPYYGKTSITSSTNC